MTLEQLKRELARLEKASARSSGASVATLQCAIPKDAHPPELMRRFARQVRCAGCALVSWFEREVLADVQYILAECPSCRCQTRVTRMH